MLAGVAWHAARHARTPRLMGFVLRRQRAGCASPLPSLLRNSARTECGDPMHAADSAERRCQRSDGCATVRAGKVNSNRVEVGTDNAAMASVLWLPQVAAQHTNEQPAVGVGP